MVESLKYQAFWYILALLLQVFLLQSSPFQEGALPSTQLLKASITERWKNRDFFLPLKSPAPCIMHGTKYVFRNI